MMSRCFLLLSCVAGVALADDGFAYENEKCWEEKKDKYMPCNAGETETTGSLTDMKKQCFDLADACAGITCKPGGTDCSLRHYPRCDDANGAFLMDSPENEITYVKTCALIDFTFAPEMQKRRSCRDPSRGGDLLQNKIACALRGTEFCAGVQCSIDKVTQKEVNCYTIDYDFCGAQLHAATVEDSAVFFAMAPVGKLPYNLECNYMLHENVVFQCNQPEDAKLTMTLAEAKMACITSKGLDKHCNGIYCKAANPLLENNCYVHEHCVAHGETQFKAGDGVGYLTRCTEGPFCVSECWDVPEMDGHVCSSDCDCTKRRVCSANGFCHEPEDIGRDVPPASPRPAQHSSKKAGHAVLLVVLVFVLIAIVAGLAYRNRQLASKYVAPTNFHAVAQNDDNNWIIEDEEKEEN
ncbi:hypothetical protein DIPPA_21588 [Diplonema papillatum]|nr:hypothetical protein DIPPA_21588 [Diplonema papillatum]